MLVSIGCALIATGARILLAYRLDLNLAAALDSNQTLMIGWNQSKLPMQPSAVKLVEGIGVEPIKKYCCKYSRGIHPAPCRDSLRELGVSVGIEPT